MITRGAFPSPERMVLLLGIADAPTDTRARGSSPLDPTSCCAGSTCPFIMVPGQVGNGQVGRAMLTYPVTISIRNHGGTSST